MKKDKLPNKLPTALHLFFWDIEAKKLDPSKKPLFVINRLLDKGNLTAVRWVRRNFPQEMIIETIKKMRDFSSKTVIFWSRLLNIPIEEIKCMREPYRSMRKMHWPN